MHNMLMNYLPGPIKKMYNNGLRTLRKYKYIVGGIVLLLAITGGGLFVHAQSSHKQEQTKAPTLKTSSAKPNPTPEQSAVEPAPAAASQPAAPVQSKTPVTTKKQTVPTAPVQQPAKAINFTLSPAVVTLTQGVTSSALQAISSTGEPLEWAVLGGNGIVAASGITSNGRTVTHSFTLTPSPHITLPGTYSMNIMGYLPGGASVTKQLTIIVQAPTTP
jgi:cytoskeletal protein RodZ